jgi:hypothetical protein
MAGKGTERGAVALRFGVDIRHGDSSGVLVARHSPE